jgi:hypothetical protein
MYDNYMIRDIQIFPGQDQRASNNGFSCAELLFHYGDPTAAVTFAVRTDWLPITMHHTTIRPDRTIRPLDLIYHFNNPTLTARQSHMERCSYIEGECYAVYDKQHLERLVDVLLAEGSEGVWRELEILFRQEARINRPVIRKDQAL